MKLVKIFKVRPLDKLVEMCYNGVNSRKEKAMYEEEFRKDKPSFKEVLYLMTATTMLYLTGCISGEQEAEIHATILQRANWTREEFEDEREARQI